MPGQPLEQSPDDAPRTPFNSLPARGSNNHSAAAELDLRLTRALEAAPRPHIPANFASSVAARLPARLPASVPVTHYGRSAILAGIVIAFAAMLVLAAPSAGRGIFRLAMEGTFLILYVSLTVWFTVSHTRAS
ncbi:MAG: hypothetical protein M3Y50_03110 [Acidobacteriota bacterium]|nr:hypothetical protein [Acidobacteriota bacterium]